MREEKVSFANPGGQKLDGVLHHPQAGIPRGGVILCHGMESNKDSDKLVLFSRELARLNLLALRFDFACADPGKFEEITYSGEVEDLVAAFSFIRDRHSEKIAVLGSSMGGTVATLRSPAWGHCNRRDDSSACAPGTLHEPVADAGAGSTMA